jgi:hypothetical protein
MSTLKIKVGLGHDKMPFKDIIWHKMPLNDLDT